MEPPGPDAGAGHGAAQGAAHGGGRRLKPVVIGGLPFSQGLQCVTAAFYRGRVHALYTKTVFGFLQFLPAEGNLFVIC